MTTVFIAGSIKIKTLDELFLERIERVLSEGFAIVVGDANGADAAVQSALAQRHAQNVTVYCSGRRARNNVGNWRLETIFSSAAQGTREFFTAKDRAMAAVADYGLFIWDLASAGTLSNVLELASERKKSVVYVKKSKTFVNIRSAHDLSVLLSMMSAPARDEADRKIGLRSRLLSDQLQFDLHL